MVKPLKKICIFCGSSFGNSSIYQEKVNELGTILAKRNVELVYGGGNVGLMGEISRSVLAHGGRVTGVIPEVIYQNVEHIELTELFVVKDMHERKAKMYDLSDGFIALPGGIGTLEELAEVMTWYQIGYHQKPIGIYNVNGFYDGLLDTFKHMINEGFLKKEYIDSLVISDDPDSLLEKMSNQEMNSINKWTK
ncbi:TIGR00730 family Rossman fold protein [Cytobacillus luteolus]|uniref:LOG family protein n=1 Tax=Litchfieldia luteola TaxID=682179 RepID=UPI002D80887B|nr:TIGR00730 family Rossman fold protein [Cytobacillus luteolus]